MDKKIEKPNGKGRRGRVPSNVPLSFPGPNPCSDCNELIYSVLLPLHPPATMHGLLVRRSERSASGFVKRLGLSCSITSVYLTLTIDQMQTWDCPLLPKAFLISISF